MAYVYSNILCYKSNEYRLKEKIRNLIMLWKDIEEIAHSLEENYHDAKIENLKLSDLHELIISLNEFDDDIDDYPDRNLNAILEAWLELRA
jgi:FeS assembly protein IscX